MAGFIPNEGEDLRGALVWMRDLTDRDADLELGLFTNVAPGETIDLASITEPAGGGYARKTLTDGNWTGDGSTGLSYAQQTFTVDPGGTWTDVQGYFIASKSAGGTPRLLAIEVDPDGPYTFQGNDEYKVTPNISEL